MAEMRREGQEVQMLWRVNGAAGIERQLLVKKAEKRKSRGEVQMCWRASWHRKLARSAEV